jgi:hypothetical protein
LPSPGSGQDLAATPTGEVDWGPVIIKKGNN